MKAHKIILIFTISILFCLGINPVFAKKPTSSGSNGLVLLNRTVALVNNQIITKSQLDNKVKTIKRQMAESKVKIPKISILRKQILNQMINQMLLLQMADNLRISVSDSQLNAEVAKIAKRNKKTVKQLYQAIQASGQTITQYRDDLRDQIKISILQKRAIASKITINNQEINELSQYNFA